MKLVSAFLLLFLLSNLNPIQSHGVEAQKYLLDNGLTLLVKEDHRRPLVAIEATVKAGVRTEGKFAGSGISHFLEHMIFKGTPTRTASSINRQINSYGGQINGATSLDWTSFKITIPVEHFQEALSLLADCLSEPAFDANELEKERSVILNEIRLRRDNPESYLNQLLWSTAYTNHPYKYPIIGDEPLFKRLTRDDLLEYYKSNYIPNNIVLSIAGDIETQSTKRIVQKVFANFQEATISPMVKLEEPPQVNLKKILKGHAVNLAYLVLGFHTTSITHPDVYPLDTLAIILGQGKSSRLYQELCQKRRLIYSVEAYNFTPFDAGLFSISGELEADNLDKVIEAILREIDGIKESRFQEGELEKAKRIVLSDYLFENQTLESQAHLLASGEITAGDFNFLARYVEGINSVRKEDIVRVARQYLTKDNLTIVALVPESEKRISPLPAPSLQPQEIKKVVLPNGLTVLLYPNHNLPIISIRTVFRGGVRVETENNNGICNLMARMLLKGTKSRTSSEIVNLIESLGGEISSYSENNGFGVSLDILSQDLNTGLALVSDILFNSTFPTEEIQKEKELILAEIKSQDDDIFKTSSKLMKETIFKIHPYKFNNLGKEETLKQLDRPKLLEFYKSYCLPNNMVLSIFGDIELNKTLELVRKNFGEIPSGALKQTFLQPQPPLDEIKESIKNIPKEEAVIMIGFPTVSIYDEDRFVFDVLSSIFSEGGSRLYDRVREERGLAYALGAFSSLGIDPGYFCLYVATQPLEVNSVRNIILEEIELLRKESIDEAEIERAKNDLIGQHLIGLQTNGALAFRSALDELYGLGYDEYTRYVEKIKAISKEDIVRVANKYLRPDGYAIVTINPL